MKIKLKEIRIELGKEELEKYSEIEFSRLVEGSFNEWSRLEENKKNIDWTGDFEIESEEEDFEYKVDTVKKYITSLDLDGFLYGEKIDIDEDIELLLSSKYSYIYELLIFHEISKLKVISDEKLKAVELNLFPKWASGYIADSLEENKTIKEFIGIFEPFMNKFEIVKKVNINLDLVGVSCEDKLIKEIFKGSIKKYIDEEVFFIEYDKEYRNLLSKVEINQLISAGQKFNPDLEEVERYS